MPFAPKKAAQSAAAAPVSPFLDPEIEAAVLAGFLQRRPDILNSGLLSSLKGEVFNVAAYKWLVDGPLKMDGGPPAKPILQQLLIDQITNADDREKYSLSLLRLYDLQINWWDQALNIFKRYIAWQTASVGITQFYSNFARTNNVELSLRELDASIGDVKRILHGGGVDVVDYASGFPDRERQRKDKRDNPDLHPCLRLGVVKFDAQVKMETGTLTNFLAPMKRYKSVILTSLAYAGLLQGYNVVLVVLENTIDLTMARLDSMVTQLSYDRVVHYLKTKSEREYAETLLARMDNWPQRLKVIKGHPNKLSTADVERELQQYEAKEGFVADVKIYDYLNLLRPTTTVNPSGKEAADHEQQTQVAWDLQGISKKHGSEAIVVTATQTNMEGAGVDKNGKPLDVKQHHQGRSIGIAQAIDNNIAVNIRVGDDAGQPPQIILAPLFFRNSAILYPEIPLVSEIDRMCIDREQRNLWNEVNDGGTWPQPPSE